MIKEKLIKYSNDVVKGKIMACKKHKWACQRFLKDINNKDFQYVFDEKKAERYLTWMTLFKHTKGKLAGQYIEPHIIQEFVFGNIYGWVHKETGLRRFKKAYWQVGRKNAKSQSLACVGSYESMAFGEPMSEVYIGATKTEQSKIVWNEIKAQVQSCEFLKGKYKIAYGKIEHLKSNSYIKALSKDDGKTGDGLNPQASIIDEYHAHKTSEIYDVLVSGSGARAQPIIMTITTAGFELNNPCYKVEYQYISNILNPNIDIDNDEYFAMVNELDKDDDVKDEKNWEKANPILFSYEEGREFLRGEAKAALDSPEKMRNFLTKNMNVWVDQRDNGYMDMSKWKKCKQDIDLTTLRGLDCYVGLDLSAKIDLTSLDFEFNVDGKYVILSHSFMPENAVAKKSRVDRVPYDMWVRGGYITATPGDVVDYRFIMSYIQNMEQENGWHIKEICYDPWNASQFAQEMELLGYTMVEIRQGMRTLAAPTKHFREEVYKGNVIHDGNPVLSWATGNAVTKQDSNENFMLDKSQAIQRIDPIASVMTSHARAMVNEEVEMNVYETRGLRIL